MLVELLLREECRPVDALHRRVLRVALPIRVRRRRQLEGLETSRRRHVRADAEIQERVLVLDRVDGHFGLACRLLLDQLHLERLAALREEVDRLLPRPYLPLVDVVLRRELLHLRFDRLEVFRHERTFDDEVVVEAVIDRRTDAALHFRKKRRHRGGQQVRRRMAIDLERLGVLVRHDPNPGVRRQRVGEVDELVVHIRDDGGVGETWRDRLGDRLHGCARLDLFCRAVRECDCDLTHWILWSTVARRVACQPKLEPVCGGPTVARLNGSSYGGQPSPGSRAKVGRRGWIRTTDLLRVREAL